jgi:polyhydroxyalkanoate synthesis regulator phasin
MYTTRNLFTVIALLPSLHAVAQDTPSEVISPPGSAPNVPLSELLPSKEEIALPDNMASETPTPAVSPSQNATINLISALVKKGVLTQAEAVALIQQAEEEATIARSEAEANAAPSMDPAGQRVTYIPEVVKNEMRDQIQQELMAQAREENWGANKTEDWTSRLIPFGDIRLRSENIFFEDGNNNTGAFPNFAAINSGSPFDTTGTVFSPQYNVDQDRYRPRLRARAGAEILLGEGFNAGLRVATGDSNSPTSPNQTLGGGEGNFSKYNLWLDRAFITYDAGPGDGEELLFMAGRFDNPFFNSEVIFDDDLGFDGLAVRANVKATDDLSVFGSMGLFPVFNTALNFASNQPSKFESTDKYLYASQIGINWKIDEDWTAKVALGYYAFQDIEGKLSSPFVPLNSSDAGDTDSTRPGFAQRGNTYFPIRNITPDPANNNGTINQFQYYGLATPFENFTFTAKIDYDGFDSIRLSALAEAIKNVAFDQSALNTNAVNNRGPDPDGAGPLLGNYDGGDMAYYTGFQIGKPQMELFGDWLVSIGYRYVESDSVVDGFADSDFGGGGTNVKGYHLGASLAISPKVRVGMRWMSSDEIAGAPLSSDTFQLDLNAKF